MDEQHRDGDFEVQSRSISLRDLLNDPWALGIPNELTAAQSAAGDGEGDEQVEGDGWTQLEDDSHDDEDDEDDEDDGEYYDDDSDADEDDEDSGDLYDESASYPESSTDRDRQLSANSSASCVSSASSLLSGSNHLAKLARAVDQDEDIDESSWYASAFDDEDQQDEAAHDIHEWSPLVALVGRVNSGKSTLFNSLTGSSSAIVSKVSGTTRDRCYGRFQLDYGRAMLVDTGGLCGEKTDPFAGKIEEQVDVALQESDLILLIIDGSEDPEITVEQRHIARILRTRLAESEKQGKPQRVLIVVNKVDNVRRAAGLEIYSRLGLGDPHPISAIHNNGLSDLVTTIERNLKQMFPDVYAAPPKAKFPLQYSQAGKSSVVLSTGTSSELEELDSPETTHTKPHEINIAIVGRPNVGKSSFLNQLIGEERAIVTHRAGTTQNPVDHRMLFGGVVPIRLIDTAGIRRRSRHKKGLERTTVLWAMRSIERADVAILVLDCTEGIIAQDMRVLQEVLDNHRSVLVVVNKWDTLPASVRHSAKETFHKLVASRLSYFRAVQIEFMSAKSGEGTREALAKAVEIYEQRQKRLSTHRLNEMVKRSALIHKPPSKGRKKLRVRFVTQSKSQRSPTFVFFVNHVELVTEAYERFLENTIRSQLAPFPGTPLRLQFRQSRNLSVSSKGEKRQWAQSTLPSKSERDAKRTAARRSMPKPSPSGGSKRIASKRRSAALGTTRLSRRPSKNAGVKRPLAASTSRHRKKKNK